jgi:hypothetical protein
MRRLGSTTILGYLCDARCPCGKSIIGLCICRYEELTKANTLPAPTQCVIHAAREVISAFFMQLISKEDPLAVRATIRMQLRPAVFFVGHAR